MNNPVWEQQPEELDRWYGRFHRYLLMGSGRSLLGCVHEEEKAAKSPKKPSKTVPGSWKDAFEKWQWRDRAAFWDTWQWQQEEVIWQERRKQWRGQQWELAQRMKERAERMMSFPLTRKTVQEGEGTSIIEPVRWSQRDAIAYLNMANEFVKDSASLHENKLFDAMQTLMQAGMASSEQAAVIKMGVEWMQDSLREVRDGKLGNFEETGGSDDG
ncbi:MAG: hypothetical protein DCF22_18215 [Leptolyngbya sp.]|nr:MAG: hypothetical protein DCF22_18215 [Leptolyngbya sp.]